MNLILIIIKKLAIKKYGKFIDNTKIGSYYSVKISDMTNTQESGLVVQSDDGYITPAAGDNLSQNEYSSYTISNPPSSAY